MLVVTVIMNTVVLLDELLDNITAAPETNASGDNQSNVSDVRQADETDSNKSIDNTSDLDAELLDTITAAPETNASGDNQSNV